MYLSCLYLIDFRGGGRKGEAREGGGREGKGRGGEEGRLKTVRRQT